MIKENIQLLENTNIKNIGTEIFKYLPSDKNANIKAICISYALQYVQRNKGTNFKDYTSFIENFDENIEVLNILKKI